MTDNKQSCDQICSPDDWVKGGKCDINGCYSVNPGKQGEERDIADLIVYVVTESNINGDSYQITRGKVCVIIKEWHNKLVATQPVSDGKEIGDKQIQINELFKLNTEKEQEIERLNKEALGWKAAFEILEYLIKNKAESQDEFRRFSNAVVKEIQNNQP